MKKQLNAAKAMMNVISGMMTEAAGGFSPLLIGVYEYAHGKPFGDPERCNLILNICFTFYEHGPKDWPLSTDQTQDVLNEAMQIIHSMQQSLVSDLN